MVSEMNLVKIIHIELSDKRWEPIVPEISRKDRFFQLFLIENSDSFKLGIPDDGFTVLF